MTRSIGPILGAFFMSALLQGGAAAAQDAVKLRAGTHQGYARLVFDWPQPVTYEAAPAPGGGAEISFARTGDLDAKDIRVPGVAAIERLSAAGQPLKIRIALESGYGLRHFTAGNRVVVDITGGGKAAAPEKPAKETTVPPPSSPPPAAAPVPAAPAPVEKTAIERAQPAVDAHVVTLSSTETIGLAAFERNGWLWLVVDRADVHVPPEIAGPHTDMFQPFEKIELKGGIAYRTKLPENSGLRAYGEGGGLIWRIVLTPNERNKPAAEATRAVQGGAAGRGGAVIWQMPQAAKIVDVADPSVGDVIKAVTVGQTDKFAGAARSFVDFDTLDSPVGLALAPKVDDLQITATAGAVRVTRPGGLALSPEKDISRRLMRQNVIEPEDAAGGKEDGAPRAVRRLFDFDRWTMGGIQALDDNQRILLSGLSEKDKSGRAQDLLALAKMNIANDRGEEALGFLGFAQDEMPALADSPEFLALRGAASALAGKFESAFSDLFVPQLKEYGEIDYWRAFTLAGLEDWKQALEILPADLATLASYPRVLLEKIGVRTAETELRGGNAAQAKHLLAILDKDRASLGPWTIAAIDYLRGEAHRQNGEYDQAKALWEPLVKGNDDLYRAKAGLALTLLEIDNGDIDYDQAVDRLEGLRYAWRGDELEAQINFTLGKLYIGKDQYLKGFTILRDAASMSPDSDVGREIAAYMTKAFSGLLIDDEDITPLDAVTVYEEFRELTPTGDEGNRLVQRLADRLVEAELLDRAAAVLQHQVDYRLKDLEKADVGRRLGVVYLLDKSPRPALREFDKARAGYAALLKDPELKAKLRELDLLRAKALSQMNQTEEAITLLNGMPPDPDINRLRADVAWQARLWEDAAEALQDIIIDGAMDLNSPVTDDQADLILSRAVALNLAGNRVEVASMRKRYYDSMKKTARGRLFDIVTRPRQTSVLADRETIDSIVSEVDLFKDFLENYKKVKTPD